MCGCSIPLSPQELASLLEEAEKAFIKQETKPEKTSLSKTEWVAEFVLKQMPLSIGGGCC